MKATETAQGSAKSYRIVLMAIGLAVLYWIATSIIHTFVFHEGDFLSTLLAHKANELWIRLVVVGILIAFGFYAQHVVNRQKRTEVAFWQQQSNYLRETFRRDVVKHKKAAKMLRESEESYRLFADNVADVIWIMNMEQHFSYISPSIRHLQGYSVEEATTTMTLKDFLTPESYEIATKALAEELAKENAPGEDPSRTRALELEMLCKGGSTVWTEAKVGFLRDKEGDAVGVVGITRDITERKRAERAVKLAYTTLDQVFQTATDGMRIIDKKFKVLRVSDTLLSLSGTSRDEALEKKCHETFSGPLCNTPDCPMTRIEAGEERVERNVEKKRKDGTVVPCILTATPFSEPGGKLIGIVENLKDITELKEASNALLESEERYRDLFENANDLVQSVAPDGSFVLVNRAWRETLGYSEDEVHSLKLSDIIHPDSHEHCEEMFQRVISGEEVGHIEAKFITKDGSAIAVEGAANCRFKDGKPIATRAIFRNITERKRAAETVKRKLEIEKTLSLISSRFVGDFEIDEAIDTSLGDLGKLGGASRAYVFLLSEDKSTMSNTHEWCAEGVSSQMETLQNIPVDMVPWWTKKLSAGEIIHIEDVSILSAEAATEKEILEKQNIKSLLVLPLHVGGKLAGFAGFDNVWGTGAWHEDDISFLSVFTDVLGRALELKEAEGKLKWHAAELKAANRKLQLLMEEVRALSLTDELTKLHNRRGFFSLAQQQIRVANRKKEGTFLLFVDFDDLKKINDTLGHAKGDSALKKIASILRKTFRTSDIIARVGGDEFAVMAVASRKDGADTLAARLHENLKKENGSKNNPFNLSASVGIAQYDPEDPSSVDELLARADKQMYKEKRAKSKA